MSPRTAARILRDAGETIRKPGAPPAQVDRAALARAYLEQGWSLNQCGTAFGIAARTAARILRDAGVTIRPGRDPHPDVDPAELTQAYREREWSIRKCAAEFGISTAAVSRTLREANVPRRPPGPQPVAIDPAELARAYQHRGLASCAEQYVTSVYTIRRLLQDQGMPIRPAGTRVGQGGVGAQQALPPG